MLGTLRQHSVGSSAASPAEANGVVYVMSSKGTFFTGML